MLCKYCKKEIENDSVFCRFCGERVQRARKKPKEEVPVPAPQLTASGKYRGRVMVAGQRVWITEDTEAAYYVRARAVKSGMIEQAKAAPKTTLGDLIDKYIADNKAVLSPSTVIGYRTIRGNSFRDYMNQNLQSIPWQAMISKETERYAAKTIKNAWRLVTAALRYAKQPVPTVNLPKSIRKERSFLDFTQIHAFLSAIQGDPYEAAYLLALHSLRYSELAALVPGSCSGDLIRVRGAVVPSEHGLVKTELNKTDRSRRDIPIMISRLSVLLHDNPLPITARDMTLNKHLDRLCRSAGLPTVTMHELRHSFASLAYHLKWTEKTTMQLGGWATPDVVHEIYTHLSSKDVNDDVINMRNFYDRVLDSENPCPNS
ncbi:MAG: tyrosine-type recombinase/integrase [Clostridia bacterium]|nr:tyrosine-type recombinase/integrase [Clostridia bacterium]